MKQNVGRYSLYDEIASGGMATVYLARQRGEKGFSRVVAVKMLHAHYAKEEAFCAMFLDEARLVSRIRHRNVVATLDVLEDDGNLLLVMEYVHGASLSGLLRAAVGAGACVPASIASAIFVDTLEGLHAAHEATSEQGTPLDVVHRDVSPQNILVGVDGVAQVADFGVAKAVGRLAEKYSVHHTVKGKAGYMAPEQVKGKVDCRTDVYAAGVVLWETLVGERLYTGESFMEIVAKSLDGAAPPPSSRRPELGTALDAIVLKALASDPKDRYATAREMAIALEQSVPRAGAREVGDWVRETDKTVLARRQQQIVRIESGEADLGERETIRELRAARVPSEDTQRERSVVPPTGEAFSPAINTIAGVAPSAPSRPVARSSSRTWWLALGAAVLASGVTVLLRPAREAAPPPPAVSSVGIILPTATTPAESVTSVPSAPSVFAAPEPEPAPPATIASSPRPVRHLPASHAPASAMRASDVPPADSTCHWEGLPDDQGIYIPKRVCK